MRKPREVKFEWWVKLYKCSSCWEFLPRERYSQNLSWYDFITSECKKCNNIRIKKYRSENKDKRNEYQRNYKAKRRMMMEAQFWEAWTYYAQVIPEPIQQPAPELTITTTTTTPIQVINTPTPKHDPVITKSVDELCSKSSQQDLWEIDEDNKSEFSEKFSRAEKLRQENIKAQKDEEEYLLQQAIEKYPDAYTEILNDESLLDVFNNRWVVSSKIENLRVRQERIDKTKKEKEHRDMVEKMRALVDTLSEEEQKEFEDKLHTLDWEWQDAFVKSMSNQNIKTFWSVWRNIYDIQIARQTWKIK